MVTVSLPPRRTAPGGGSWSTTRPSTAIGRAVSRTVVTCSRCRRATSTHRVKQPADIRDGDRPRWPRLAYPPAGQRRQQAAYHGYARQFPTRPQIVRAEAGFGRAGPGLAQASARAPDADLLLIPAPAHL